MFDHPSNYNKRFLSNGNKCLLNISKCIQSNPNALQISGESHKAVSTHYSLNRSKKSPNLISPNV